MRILFLYPFPLWGNGSGEFLRSLSSQLIERGHQIAIVSPDKRKLQSVKHYVVNSPQNGVFIGHPEWPKAKKLSEMSGKELGDVYISYLKTSIDATVSFKPDIVHAFHTAFLPGVARILRTLYGMKFIITTHGSDVAYFQEDRRLVGLTVDANKAAKFITAVSESARKRYINMFGYNLRRKMKVITGGVTLADYKRDDEKVEELNRKYKLHDKKVVLFSGRLTKEKGVSYLVKAAPNIKGTVVILGGGPEKTALEELIEKNKIKNVIMVGYMRSSHSRLFHAFYQRADVYVNPSVVEEALGLTILEAMASSTPVVATKKGGVVSVIKEGENGFFIRARNSKQMAEIVNKVLFDDALRKKISLNAKKTIVERFAWEKIAGQFEAVYNKFVYPVTERPVMTGTDLKGNVPSLTSRFNRILRKTKFPLF